MKNDEICRNFCSPGTVCSHLGSEAGKSSMRSVDIATTNLSSSGDSNDADVDVANASVSPGKSSSMMDFAWF